MDRKAKNIQLYIKTDRLTTYRQIYRQAGSPAGRQAERQTDRQTYRLPDRQTDRQTDRKTDRKTDVGVMSTYGTECTVLQYTGEGGGGP